MEKMTEHKMRKLASEKLSVDLSVPKRKLFVHQVVESFLKDQQVNDKVEERKEAQEAEEGQEAEDDKRRSDGKEYDDGDLIIAVRISCSFWSRSNRHDGVLHEKKAAHEERKIPYKQSHDEMPPPSSLQVQGDTMNLYQRAQKGGRKDGFHVIPQLGILVLMTTEEAMLEWQQCLE